MTDLALIVHPHTTKLMLLMLYVGPDQMLPVLSFLGAIVGFLLMMWHRLAGMVRRVLKLGRKEQSPTEPK
jgi:hypothetical protein